MKNTFRLFVILAIISQSYSAFCQYYHYSMETGTDSYMYYFRSYASHVYSPPKEDELSAWQALPFTWDFFGKPVTGYFISDNGYITFNGNATESIPENTEIPSASCPLNTIFAYWTDMHLESGNPTWTNEVCTSTIGNAPDRVHVIYWMNVIPAGSTYAASRISFAIALYEGGGFDIINTTAFNAAVLKGTAGAKNIDGTQAVSIAGSPVLAFPGVGFGDADDVCHRFKLASSVCPEKYISNNSINMEIIPNPTSESFNIIFNMPKRVVAHISIYDLSGSAVKEISCGEIGQDRQSLTVNVSDMAEGLYFISVNSANFSSIQKLIISK